MEILSKNKIKWIRTLRLKKNRVSEGLFIVEGEKMVRELLENHPEIVHSVYSTEEISTSIPFFKTDDVGLKQISSLQTPNKMLAVVKIPENKTPTGDLILALDGVQDPGNMGTIIRTADWFGVDHIVCSQDTVDCYNEKVVQSTMGSLFRIPISYLDLSEFLKSCETQVYGALLSGKNVYEMELSTPCVLVMGNEGNGISAKIAECVSHELLIPQFGQAESLNVGIATGVLLSEIRR